MKLKIFTISLPFTIAARYKIQAVHLIDCPLNWIKGVSEHQTAPTQPMTSQFL